jgi:protein-L-isoaspartate(D-aspartate) O-methyltransferase
MSHIREKNLVLLGRILAVSLAAILVASLAPFLVACTSEELPPTSLVEPELPVAAQPQESPPGLTPTTGSGDPYLALRQKMVREGVIDWGIEDEAVIAAMQAVPRQEFVPETYRRQAYDNHPLPIGYGQTISQPYIVALMTQSAGLSAGDKVLEIGTGSGYQAAVLAEIVDRVFTMEIIEPLAETSTAVLKRLGYDNVTTRFADGYFGWDEEAPFDAIIVTAAPDHVPQPLVEQLKIGGKLIIPVGPVGGFQTLWLITKVSEEEVTTVDLGGVTFVPLTREQK